VKPDDIVTSNLTSSSHWSSDVVSCQRKETCGARSHLTKCDLQPALLRASDAVQKWHLDAEFLNFY